jgi:hypothetical protein
MIDDSKWVGTFESTGLKFTIETPGSSVITKKLIVDERRVVSIHEVTEYGTILKQERYLDGVLTETTLGHIKVIRNCCGKVITKLLEFVDGTDNGSDQWYTLKRDKNGFVQEYSINYIESGISATNPKQIPTISIKKAKRVA